MESSSKSASSRTQECLAELEARFKNTGSPAKAILLVGRLGTGKSSLLEDVTGLSGYSQQSADSVTQNVEIAKAVITNKEYFIMDTPGFNPGNEEETYREIIRGIQAIRPFARIVGLLYLTCVNQPRFDGFDRKLAQFIRALCGDEYIHAVTFTTTFWTVAGEEQLADFNRHFEFLQSKWKEVFGAQGLNLYQHGQEYNASGLPTGSVINWFPRRNRDQIARHAKEMIARNYDGPTTASPRIVEELDANTPINMTEAGRILDLHPPPAEESSSASNGQPGRESSEQYNSASSGDSDPRSSRDRSRPSAEGVNDTQQERERPQPPAPTWGQTLLDVIGRLARNVEINVDLGGGPMRGQNFAMGSAHSGTLDPLSSVDVMRSFGLDYSREGRLRYAARHGIGGEPFSAAWGDAIRRDVRRRYG
ncbi:hypothetical protein IFM53868_06607 [Aspergillus udagawae]|uniref:AIG1-type G domain-containing protein n=1 Tax=Aspergillus udagawae TaxID=91492 RepID=A0A8E0V2H5_9EURO|nr:uncharacterized protein Aud_007955 [Aspergillus udagawae]GFF91741.1 hypothetical protein IFM53868_06607 [Aspergillus udagawae]GFG20762.1 hypothetical protein IFM5058_10768 [Aspergillus udagawae]GIC91511.1 hypothetical protein Aud_007955 [Aspergillus udagawae]